MALADGKKIYWSAFVEGLTPDPLLTVSEWSDQHRFLSQRASAEPGVWRTDRTPYLREIMDSLSALDPTEKVVFMKGAQIGGTEAGNNWLGYVIDIAPGPYLMVAPTVEMAKRNSRTRIAPLIDESPRLKEKVRDPRSRDSGNSMLAKEFPGGVVVMCGANSASALRSMPARYLFLDEVDAYPGDVEGEGDPVALAEARTRTFSRRKIFMVSTPTLANRSRVEREFLASDMRFFEVPCPHCGAYQQLVWENLRWQDDDPGDVRYACRECGALFEEHHKSKMLAAGKWVPSNPEGLHRGYHLSSLYSPVGWMSWKSCVELYIAAQKNDEAMRVFTNTILGLTFADAGEAPDWEDLYNRRETYAIGTVPDPKIGLLTAGVDVQQDRIEMEVIGWGPNLESWSIDYVLISGNTAEDEVWNELSKRIRISYPSSCGGRTLPIRMVAIDSGYRTQEVYRWVRGEQQSRVIAIKGREAQATVLGQPSSVDVTRKGKTWKGGVRVWPVGVAVAKSELYGWLRRKQPTNLEDGYPFGWCHFPQYPDEYFRQLTAEQLVSRVVRGYQKWQWEKTRDRNEALDVRVYARAAATALGVDRWDEARWKTEMAQNAVPVETGDKAATGIRRRKGSFLSR